MCPLRGEKPNSSSADNGRADFGRVSLIPDDLLETLAPVAHLWAGITRVSTAKWVAKAVRVEIARIGGIVGHEVAGSVLAARLERRLCNQGPHAVHRLVGWLLRRGLRSAQSAGPGRCPA